jgi:hypothetical protein
MLAGGQAALFAHSSLPARQLQAEVASGQPGGGELRLL